MIAFDGLDFAATTVDFLGRQSVLATIVFVVVAPLCWLFRRRPAVCYLLWSLVLVRLVLPVDLGHRFSASSLVERLLATSRSMPESVRVVAVPLTADSTAAVPVSGVDGWKLALLGVWLTGVAVVLILHGRRRARCRKWVSEAVPCRDPSLLEIFERGRRRCGIRREVRLLISNAPVIPFTVGVRRPIVLLPSLVAQDRHLAEVALAHELAHVARRDSLFLGVQSLILAVYFFHPLAWLAGFFLHSQRERICDAMALSCLDLSPKRFAEGLLAILRLRLQPAAPAALINTHKRSLGMRIRNILEYRRHREGKVFGLFLTLMMAVFLLPLSAQSGNDTAGDTSLTPAYGVVVRFILMTGVEAEGSRWIPTLAAKHFEGDVALTTEEMIHSIEKVLRGSAGLDREGSFWLRNEFEGKATTLSGKVLTVEGAAEEQYRVDIEVRVNGDLVSAPSLVLLAGRPGAISTIVDGKQVALFLLIQE